MLGLSLLRRMIFKLAKAGRGETKADVRTEMEEKDEMIHEQKTT